MNLGSRRIANGKVAQQGTKEYQDDIIRNMKEKLGDNHSLVEKLEDAVDNGELSYILIKQGINSETDFLVKNFP